MNRSRLHLLAILASFSMLVLVISGAVITSSAQAHPSQPGLLTIHSALAIAIALLITGLVVALARISPPRLTWFGCITLVALLFEILMADLLKATSGPFTGTLHATLAAFLVAALSAMALVTSPSWQRDPDLVQDYGWPSLKSLSTVASFLVAVQVGFGAGIRHSAVGVLPHLLGALVVALLLMLVGVFVLNQFPKHAALRPAAIALMAVTGIQVFLGLTVFLMRMMNVTGTKAWLLFSLAHVTTGSLTFAASIVLAIEIRRDVRPREAAQ
jgi:hypothetical protein